MGEEKGLIWLAVAGHSPKGEAKEGTQAGTRRQKPEGLLLAGFLPLASLATFLLQPRTLPREGTTRSGLGHLISISNLENVPGTHPQAKTLIRAFPFPQAIPQLRVSC